MPHRTLRFCVRHLQPSLLRPRGIKPGDPVLRVRADNRLNRLSPCCRWAKQNTMVYLTDQDVPGRPDSLLRLEMADRCLWRHDVIFARTHPWSRVYQEEKRDFCYRQPTPPKFVSETQPGFLFQAGEEFDDHRATADSDTRRIHSASIGCQPPVDLRWSKNNRTLSVGKLRVPLGLASGGLYG